MRYKLSTHTLSVARIQSHLESSHPNQAESVAPALVGVDLSSRGGGHDGRGSGVRMRERAPMHETES